MAVIDNKLMTIIGGVIGVVILFTAAPELWTVLDSALNSISSASIPLVSGMTGVVGLVFGAIILVGGLVYLFKLLSNRR